MPRWEMWVSTIFRMVIRIPCYAMMWAMVLGMGLIFFAAIVYFFVWTGVDTAKQFGLSDSYGLIFSVVYMAAANLLVVMAHRNIRQQRQ